MKICLMTSVYALSDEDRHAAFLVESTRYLTQRGHEIQVLAPSYEGLPSHSIDGVPVHRFRYFPARWEHLTHGQGAPNRIRNPVYMLVAAFYILAGLVAAIRLCRREHFDVIHVHWPFPHAIWGYAASRLSGAPMVLTFHGAELLLARKFFFVTPVLRAAIARAKGVICNSRFTAGEVRRISGYEAEIIPFGVTVAAKPAAKRRDKTVKDILFVGRLIRRKGVDVLLQAMMIVTGRLPCQLHVVGDGDMRQPWMALAKEAGCENVIFHGLVSNERLQALYADADAFVLPAIVDDRGDTEGLGVVLVEALSFATPVVASNVGGIPDVIIDGETGLLVPEKDAQALADAIVRILTNEALARRLARAGLRHAQTYFDWARITDRFEDVYFGARAASG